MHIYIKKTKPKRGRQDYFISLHQYGTFNKFIIFLLLLWLRGVENIWKGEKSEGKKKIYIYNESKKLE